MQGVCLGGGGGGGSDKKKIDLKFRGNIITINNGV